MFFSFLGDLITCSLDAKIASWFVFCPFCGTHYRMQIVYTTEKVVSLFVFVQEYFEHGDTKEVAVSTLKLECILSTIQILHLESH